jgi:ketosteroid isomerase-like protein
MSEAQNTQLVKDAYAAFQRGDITAILNMLDEAVDWHGVIGTEFDTFDPREFIAQGDKVAVMGR